MTLLETTLIVLAVGLTACLTALTAVAHGPHWRTAWIAIAIVVLCAVTLWWLTATAINAATEAGTP